jgi:hypothetical protein
MGGYDGDLLFENLELMRTAAAAGGRVVSPLDLFVRRLPPSPRHFLSQRVRQAYDDFALPARLCAFLAIAPALLLSPPRARGIALGAGMLASTALAEAGRQRGKGREVFPPDCSLFAIAWVAERALTSWAALGARIFLGGVPYAGTVIRRAATPLPELRRRLAPGAPEPHPGR